MVWYPGQASSEVIKLPSMISPVVTAKLADGSPRRTESRRPIINRHATSPVGLRQLKAQGDLLRFSSRAQPYSLDCPDPNDDKVEAPQV